MKPEAWYDEAGNFRPHEQALAMMDFARDNDLRVYGHVLVWHSQTPAWFFTDSAGQPLSTSAADQQVLRDRLRTHIFNVAESMSERYGKFGSPTNPLYAFDAVNEVVSDSGDRARCGSGRGRRLTGRVVRPRRSGPRRASPPRASRLRSRNWVTIPASMVEPCSVISVRIRYTLYGTLTSSATACSCPYSITRFWLKNPNACLLGVAVSPS